MATGRVPELGELIAALNRQGGALANQPSSPARRALPLPGRKNISPAEQSVLSEGSKRPQKTYEKEK